MIIVTDLKIKIKSTNIIRASSILCIGLTILLASNILFGQMAGKVSGVVRDAETGEPLVGCNVTIIGTTLGASTDVEGAFFILNVPPGKYDIQAFMLGYRKVVQRGSIVNSGRTTAANFQITSTELLQKEVVIEATRPDVEMEKTSTSAIIRTDDIQSIAGIRDVGDVLGLAADITDGHFRGGRAGEEYYTLQGMGIVNPLDNSSAFLPIMSAVEEVEVITSGFGAQYGNAQSGVVNITMKEGKSDKWRTRVEGRMRAQGRKHFGESVFDPYENPYLAALLFTDSLWLAGDPASPSRAPYYTAFFPIDNYRGDTLVQLQVARALWQRQMKRDLNRNYWDNIDNSIEASTGGPISEDLRMFMALRSNTTWPVFLTEEPDYQRQVMGNLATDFGKNANLRLSGGFTQEYTQLFPSSDALGFYNWLWDRSLTINYQKKTNLQIGARFTHTLSPSTFYEVKINALVTKRKVGSTPAPSSEPDSMITNPANRISWDKVIPQVVQGPDKFYYLRGDDQFKDELTQTVSIDASMTSQVTKSHLLNGGLQFNNYLIDVSNYLEVRVGTGGDLQQYKVRPYEGALYLQDKMEFEGLIANVGLRFDIWNSNTNYYTNIFTPYLVVDYAGRPSSDPNRAPQEKAPIIGRLQPRIGISFPVSVNTVFHINYGSFMQRPAFQYVISSRFTQGLLTPVQLGNPKLQPQTTNSYDIGVMQGLGEGFTFDVSGYYKDVKNLVDQATFTSIRTGGTYTTWFNRDYADIRGFRLALSKKRGAFTGSINYQYGVATGKSATTSFAPVAFVQDTNGTVAALLNKVPVRDILLDFDRTHNLIINLGYTTDENWGPKIFNEQILSDITLSTMSFFRSGRPYTSPQNPKLINGARSPDENNTNLRLTKKIHSFLGTDATLYFEVFNLFNQKILNYNYVFSVPDAGQTNNVIQNYENYGIDDPVNGIRYYQEINTRPEWALVDQSFLIYENAPRSYNFGLVIEL